MLPRLANEPWLDYLVFISTAINWTEQGNYLRDCRWASQAESDPEGYRRAIERDHRFDALFHDDDSDYEDYLQLKRQLIGLDSDDAMSPFRFTFAKRTVREDASKALSDIQVPVLAMFGTDDLNVDIHDTRSTYSRIFNTPPSIDFTSRIFKGASHQLTKSSIYNAQVPGLWYWVLFTVFGDSMFADGVLNQTAEFAAGLSNLPDYSQEH